MSRRQPPRMLVPVFLSLQLLQACTEAEIEGFVRDVAHEFINPSQPSDADEDDVAAREDADDATFRGQRCDALLEDVPEEHEGIVRVCDQYDLEPYLPEAKDYYSWCLENTEKIGVIWQTWRDIVTACRETGAPSREQLEVLGELKG